MADNQPARKSADAFDFKGWLALGARRLKDQAMATGRDYARQTDAEADREDQGDGQE